jgi:hypothetical protein
LLAKLAATDPDSAAFDKVLQDLVDAVSHHVDEEESSVLPGIRARLSEKRRLELGEAFAASRKEHLGDQPDDITRAELLQQARNADISGVSSLDKDALQKKLREEASE